MMANAARDPYWQAGVRRETIEHPTAHHEIENECSKCHMPMATVTAHTQGKNGQVFAHFAARSNDVSEQDRLAQDGVSCSLCHQIQPTHLGERQSLTGGFVVDTQPLTLPRREFGPVVVERGRAHVMSSASRMTPVAGAHLSNSEVCATCHTLYTHALDASGKVVGELPEQVPYQEWLHSAYRNSRSCQSCHMPYTAANSPFSSVAGEPRPRLREHRFVGGNFFMLGLFTRFGDSLTASASATNFELAAERTRSHLQTEPARLQIDCVQNSEHNLVVQVSVENLGGHKLPTAYPSRRVWLHLRVEDARGQTLFESGALEPSGAIVGNDNDQDPNRFEAHYDRITNANEVAIYESILGGPDGKVTTGLLTASRYLKDNRLLPRGFDKTTAAADVAVHGEALDDPSFKAGNDLVSFDLALPGASAHRVIVELYYQPIGYRWATNLHTFSSMETTRFVNMYSTLSANSAVILASVTKTL
jgi:hypothetical protein